MTADAVVERTGRGLSGVGFNRLTSPFWGSPGRAALRSGVVTVVADRENAEKKFAPGFFDVCGCTSALFNGGVANGTDYLLREDERHQADNSERVGSLVARVHRERVRRVVHDGPRQKSGSTRAAHAWTSPTPGPPRPPRRDDQNDVNEEVVLELVPWARSYNLIEDLREHGRSIRMDGTTSGGGLSWADGRSAVLDEARKFLSSPQIGGQDGTSESMQALACELTDPKCPDFEPEKPACPLGRDYWHVVEAVVTIVLHGR